MALHRPPIWQSVPVLHGASVEELRQRLGEPNSTAWAAFEALGHTPGTEALQVLLEATRSADWRYRRCAIEAISSHSLTPVAAEVLLHALADLNKYVAIEACEAVAQHRLLQAHGQVINLLSHTEASVREAAVTAIAYLFEPQDFELIKKLHISDHSSLTVRKKAGYTLFENASATTWQALFDLWQASPAGRYRLWAVYLAQQFGGSKTGQLLQGFVNDKDGHVRKAANRGTSSQTTSGTLSP